MRVVILSFKLQVDFKVFRFFLELRTTRYSSEKLQVETIQFRSGSPAHHRLTQISSFCKYVFKNDSTFCRSLRLGGAMSIAALYFELLKGQQKKKKFHRTVVLRYVGKPPQMFPDLDYCNMYQYSYWLSCISSGSFIPTFFVYNMQTHSAY